ncbi:MAG TPA: hypothetical protein GX530_10165 [Corynebacteriales bacterium]|nr:hypothetical protein [Mycobacteriales bacterium]
MKPLLDNYSIHKVKLVKEWLTSHPLAKKLYYFPCYTPQLNPIKKIMNSVVYSMMSAPFVCGFVMAVNTPIMTHDVTNRGRPCSL